MSISVFSFFFLGNLVVKEYGVSCFFFALLYVHILMITEVRRSIYLQQIRIIVSVQSVYLRTFIFKTVNSERIFRPYSVMYKISAKIISSVIKSQNESF